MRIEGLSIENFTLFGKNQFKFSDGLNIIVGENDTGKSHLHGMVGKQKHVCPPYPA